MPRETQHPVESNDTENRGTIARHPAFALVGAHRITGSAVLYGSDFRHDRYIRIAIRPSDLKRNLSSDWPHNAGRPLIEIDMSEAQWARFISTLNVGEGTQCTLYTKDGEQVPGIPDPVNRQDQFTKELARMNREALKSLHELSKAIADSGLSVRKQNDLSKHVGRAEQMIEDNSLFVAEQFVEHMDKVTQEAKIEVNAYAARVMNGQPTNLQLEQPTQPTNITQA